MLRRLLVQGNKLDMILRRDIHPEMLLIQFCLLLGLKFGAWPEIGTWTAQVPLEILPTVN